MTFSVLITHHSVLLSTAVPGFEPGNGGFKVRCLTAWRHRNNKREYYHKGDSEASKIYNSCRPSNALPKVISSVYSKSPPTGKPRAKRVRRIGFPTSRR